MCMALAAPENTLCIRISLFVNIFDDISLVGRVYQCSLLQFLI